MTKKIAGTNCCKRPIIRTFCSFTPKRKKRTTQFKPNLFIFLQENNKILLLETKKKYLLFIAQFHWISDVLIGRKITKLMYQIQLNIDFRILLFWLPCQTLKNLESNCFLSFSHKKYLCRALYLRQSKRLNHSVEKMW